jgi:hypothetical protein
MIGHFKSSEDAEKTQELIKELSEGLRDKIDIGAIHDRYDPDVLDLLIKTDCSSLSRFELEHFLYEDSHTRVEGDKIILTTDEFEISAFFKLMILKGAKVEIYSAHEYPDVECGPGK